MSGKQRKAKTFYDDLLTLQRAIERRWKGARFVISVAYTGNGGGRIDYTNVPDEDRRKKFLGVPKSAASNTPPGGGPRA